VRTQRSEPDHQAHRYDRLVAKKLSKCSDNPHLTKRNWRELAGYLSVSGSIQRTSILGSNNRVETGGEFATLERVFESRMRSRLQRVSRRRHRAGALNEALCCRLPSGTLRQEAASARCSFYLKPGRRGGLLGWL
jgi:hypothetical protein